MKIPTSFACGDFLYLNFPVHATQDLGILVYVQPPLPHQPYLVVLMTSYSHQSNKLQCNSHTDIRSWSPPPHSNGLIKEQQQAANSSQN